MAEFRVQKTWEFIPSWNKENVPEGEKPVRFQLQALTHSQRARLMPWETDSSGKTIARFDYAGMFLAGVVAIFDLTVNGREITKPDQLLNETGFDALWREVAQEIMAGAEVKSAKN